MSDPKATTGAAPYRRAEVFISYRRSGNAGDAERLYDELKRYFPERRLFLDVKSIRKGDSFPLAISTALDSCRVLLAVIGPQWLNTSDEGGRRLDDPSDMVRREVSAALAKGVWLIPMLTHGAAMPSGRDLPDDIKRLAECEAVEIRGGHWEKDIKELVGLLKRRLYRRRRLAAALAFAAALVVVAALTYQLATVTLPVDINSGDRTKIPPVQYHERRKQGQAAGGEETPLELVVEGIPAAEGEALNFNGKPVADVRVDFDGARFEETSVRRLIDELKPEWGGKSGALIYSVGHDPAERKMFEKEIENFDNACSTSVTVAAGAADASLFSLRFFQEDQSEDPDQPVESREIHLQADRELAVKSEVKTVTVNDSAHGPGCSKVFNFDGVNSGYALGESVAFVTSADAPFALLFHEVDTEKTSARPDLLRLDKKDSFDFLTPSLRASRVVVRARDGEEVACGDNGQGRAPTIYYEARSADGKSSLRLNKLKIGANDFSLDAEGEAYVESKCVTESPGVVERAQRHTLLASLLLASACAALVGLAYSVARL